MPTTTTPRNGGKRKLNTNLNLNQELVMGMLANARYWSFIGQITQALPRYIDDAQRDFGLDIYDRMLRDPAIFSAISAIKVLVLSEGVRFLPGAKSPSQFKPDPEAQARYDRAVEIAAFVEDCCSNLQAPLAAIIEDMLDYMAYGYTVAEQTYKAEGGKVKLGWLRVKARSSYWFVVNRFLDLQGLIAVKPGLTAGGLNLAAVSPQEIIPREKFLVLSFRPQAGDPRGTSLLRPCYNPWYLSQQIYPEWFKFLKQFATPSVAGEAPPDAGDVEIYDSTGSPSVDADGNPLVMSAEEAFLQKLILWTNGTAMVYPNGADVRLLESKGDGEAYVKALDFFDRQKTRAILLAVRAVMESQFGSKADSETAQDLLNSFAQHIRRQVEAAFNRDVIRPLVLYNYGEEAAAEMSPNLSLSDTPREDRGEIMNGIANLGRASMLHPSQYAGIDAMLGLPERDMEAQQEQMAAEREAQQDRTQMLAGLMPGSNLDDEAE